MLLLGVVFADPEASRGDNCAHLHTEYTAPSAQLLSTVEAKYSALWWLTKVFSQTRSNTKVFFLQQFPAQENTQLSPSITVSSDGI